MEASRGAGLLARRVGRIEFAHFETLAAESGNADSGEGVALPFVADLGGQRRDLLLQDLEDLEAGGRL